MGTIGPLAVVTGFSPNSSHVAAAPILIQASRIRAHGSWNTDQESWNTDHGPGGGVVNMSQLFEMWRNCGRIVARLRQKTPIPRVSAWYRRVSAVSAFCRFLYTYVAPRLELFQCKASSATLCQQCRYPSIPCRYPADTPGIGTFMLNEWLISRVLGDRSALFTIADTQMKFSARINKKIKINLIGIDTYIALFQPQLRHRKL